MVIRKRAAYTTTKRIMPALSRDFPQRWSDGSADAKIRPTNNVEDEGDGAGKIEELNDLTSAGRCGGVFGKTLA